MPMLICLYLLVFSAAHANVRSLSDLLVQARDHQLEWQTAIANTKKAEDSVTIQRSQFLPDFGLQSSYSYDWQPAVRDQESTGSRAALISNWQLYDNGTSFRKYRIKKIELERAQLQEIVTREQVSYEILSRYILHQQARRLRDIAAQKLNLLQGQYRVTERMYKQGLKTRRDYQRLYTEVERTKLSLSRQEDETQNTFEELQRYLGQPSFIQKSEDLKFVSGESLLNSLIKRMDRFRFTQDQVPVVRISSLNIEVQKLLKTEAQATLWPEINLSASAGYGSDQFIRTNENWNDRERLFTGAQLQFNWKLFEWGARSSSYRSATLDQQIADSTFHQERLNAQASFTKRQRQATRQASNLKVVRDIFNIEKKTFVDIQAEYRNGNANYLDLITSLDRQSQAETDLELEVNNYLLVLAELLQQSGSLYETITKF